MARSFSDFGPALVVPIPIRADLIVHISGLPDDLTPAEARKIGRVVLALASPEAVDFKPGMNPK